MVLYAPLSGLESHLPCIPCVPQADISGLKFNGSADNLQQVTSSAALPCLDNHRGPAIFRAMTDAEKAAIKRSIDIWKQAGPELQKQRDADIRAADTVRSIQSMTLLFRDAIKNSRPRESSGLVEQQRWFMKLRTA